MASGKRRRVEANDSDEDMASDRLSPASTSSEPSEDVDQPVKRRQLGADGSNSPASTSILCGLPSHAEMEFPDWHSYEVHYQQNHVNRCSACNRNFPTDHFLQLHITENHDPITAVQRERGEKTYACFVEGCDKTCATPQKRRLHLIDKHSFPKLYDFLIVNNGIDRRTSMLRGDRSRKHRARRRANSKAAIASTEGEEQMDEDGEEAVSTLTKSMSTLKFVPRSLQFGRGSSKTFMR